MLFIGSLPTASAVTGLKSDLILTTVPQTLAVG